MPGFCLEGYMCTPAGGSAGPPIFQRGSKKHNPFNVTKAGVFTLRVSLKECQSGSVTTGTQ
jgi:hypothetical protein